MTKEEIRKTYLKKRQALTESEFQSINHRIAETFFACVDLSDVQVLHTFLPIEKQREVNTWLIIDRIKRDFPDVRISIPRINNQNATIESFYFENREQLEKNTWDILEPKEGIPTPVERIDLVLVPLLAADHSGNRVGYGRGFYDKFLATVSVKTKKIGLSLFPPVDHITNISATDIPINAIVTTDQCHLVS